MRVTITIRALLRRTCFTGALALLAYPGHAAQPWCIKNIEITKASVQLTPGDPSKATALVTVVNRGEQPDQFQSALCTVARHVELSAGDVTVPPNGTRELRLELSDINQKLGVGSQFPLVLIFETACLVRFDVQVIDPVASERR